MQEHESVLLHESITHLALPNGGSAIDATVGLGGHTLALSRAVGKKGRVLGIEADEQAIRIARVRVKDAPSPVDLVHGNFRNIDLHAKAAGFEQVDGILFDLGWNTTQLSSGRGFSFNADDPLVMTFSATVEPDTVTARRIVNEWSEEDMEDVIRTLGEERHARRIAQGIARARRISPIETARGLAEVIHNAVPFRSRTGRIHPATKTFQALRMMVNDELSTLSVAIPKALDLLGVGGRLAVITFHSLEDRLIKRMFIGFTQTRRATLVTKKPIIPTREETLKNRRARSAKLRIIERI